MKIALIGSTQFIDKIGVHMEKLANEGHEVRVPAFDAHELNELQIIAHNRSLIEWADEVYIFWDGRSTGSVFDFGMVFALRKPFHIGYLEPKTLANAMKQYEELWQED